MKIEKIFLNSALYLNSLARRLVIEAKALRTVSDKEEVFEQSEHCVTLAEGLDAINAAYGPILQSAIDVGMSGKTHKIFVMVRNPEATGDMLWSLVSEHEFKVETK
jgi:hypothetical protein